ncbi:MAG: hypothetical protein ACOCRO_10710 [Halanaerobiales bacterium]
MSDKDDNANWIFWLIMIAMFLAIGGPGIPFLVATPYGWVIGLFILIIAIAGMGKSED